jgi:hypothetical protein
MLVISQEEQSDAEHPGSDEKAAQPPVVAKVLLPECAFHGRGSEDAEESNAVFILGVGVVEGALGVHGIALGLSVARGTTKL